MTILIQYLKDNYIDIISKVCLSILSIILLLLRRHASSSLKKSEQLSAFFQWLPSAVRYANQLFPEHGDGSKRLNYVVEKSSSLFPLVTLSTIVCGIDQILLADKKGGDVYETGQGETEERSQDLCENCKVDQSKESSPSSDERRNSFVSFIRS